MSGTKYPTNGNTIEEFIDPKGELKSLSIEVPKVNTKEVLQGDTTPQAPAPQPEQQNVIKSPNPATGDININLIITTISIFSIILIATYIVQFKKYKNNK